MIPLIGWIILGGVIAIICVHLLWDERSASTGRNLDQWITRIFNLHRMRVPRPVVVVVVSVLVGTMMFAVFVSQYVQRNRPHDENYLTTKEERELLKKGLPSLAKMSSSSNGTIKLDMEVKAPSVRVIAGDVPVTLPVYSMTNTITTVSAPTIPDRAMAIVEGWGKGWQGVFYGLVVLALVAITGKITDCFQYAFRSLNIIVRGWPPTHLDADGDSREEPRRSNLRRPPGGARVPDDEEV